ncbi:MAG: hypothetical protein KDD70_14720 [Bdellovibrionales bacterium]|nr:hypothetical protein [Bdellovibrionales bacterium]
MRPRRIFLTIGIFLLIFSPVLAIADSYGANHLNAGRRASPYLFGSVSHDLQHYSANVFTGKPSHTGYGNQWARDREYALWREIERARIEYERYLSNKRGRDCAPSSLRPGSLRPGYRPFGHWSHSPHKRY